MFTHPESLAIMLAIGPIIAQLIYAVAIGATAFMILSRLHSSAAAGAAAESTRAEWPWGRRALAAYMALIALCACTLVVNDALHAISQRRSPRPQAVHDLLPAASTKEVHPDLTAPKILEELCALMPMVVLVVVNTLQVRFISHSAVSGSSDSLQASVIYRKCLPERNYRDFLNTCFIAAVGGASE